MKSLTGLCGIFLCAWIFCGCANVQSKAPSTVPPQLAVRNNAASLLFDLLNDEKNVSKLLIIKRARPELRELIKTISKTAENASKNLARTANEDASMDLHAMNLPAGEVAARDAESKTKEHELLHASGVDLEFQLLLSQAEALNYGRHLAEIAAEKSSTTRQAMEFTDIAKELQQLYQQTISLLRAPAMEH